MAKQEKSAAELYREERKARLAKAAKKNSKKRNKIIWNKKNKSVATVAFVLAIVMGLTAIVLNSLGMFERNKKMMTVGGAEVDKYEVVYYSSRIYQNMFENAVQYDQYGEGYGLLFTGLDWQTQPDKQSYAGTVDGIENPTVADYIVSQAKTELQRVKAYVKYAEENSITLDAADVAQVQSVVNDMKTAAQNSGYGYANFLRSEYGYGKGMTPKLFEKIITEAVLAEKVQELKNEEFTEHYDAFSEEEIEKIFTENIKKFGVVSYRSYTVKADDASEMEAAKKTAETLAALEGEEAFLKYVSELEEALKNEKYADYLTNDTLTLTENESYESVAGVDYDHDHDHGEEGASEAEKCGDWLFDAERRMGETYILEAEGKGYTVYMVTDPVHKVDSEYTYDVRHILVKFPEEKTEEKTEDADTAEDKKEEKDPVKAELLDTSAYEAIVDIDVDVENVKDSELYMKAQDILKEYLEGENTEEAFGELAKKYSEDGNASQGGLYEDVTKDYMVDEFENWAFEEGRKAGDVGIVETEFGYHVMYFVKTEEVSNWITVIKDNCVAEDYTELEEGIIAAAPVADYNAKYASDVKDFIKTTARTLIKNNTEGTTISF